MEHIDFSLRPDVVLFQKKANGAPNGFYGEIDWDRYVSLLLSKFWKLLVQTKKKKSMSTFMRVKYEAGVEAALISSGSLCQASPDVDEEGFSLQPADEAHNILSVSR